MPKFPEPPAPEDLAALPPLLRSIPAATRFGRIFSRGGTHPVGWNDLRHWGPTAARFDHHLPDAGGAPWLQPRGILYAAGAAAPGALAICAAEVFQSTRIIDSRRNDPWFAVFATARALSLLDLGGLWATRAGASQALASGPRPRARRWSQAIFAAYPQIDGLYYPSSMAGGGAAVALYERAADALPAAPLFHRSLADPALSAPLSHAAQAIGYGLS